MVMKPSVSYGCEKMVHDWDGYEKPGYMGEESTKLCVSTFLSYIFTMWKFVNVTVYTMQQYHFTLTISTCMSQELWIREIYTDRLVHVAPRKVCTERSIPLLGINVLVMTMIHHHHHHVPEGLGVFPVPSFSRWSWSLHLFLSRPMFLHPSGLYCSACFGNLFVSMLCTCCSHFFWCCFISFTVFCAPVFCLIHWFFSLSSFVIPSKYLKI